MASVASRQHSRRSPGGFLAGSSSWLFLLPTVFFFVLWQLWPILQVAWISLTDYRFLAPDTPTIGIHLWRFHFTLPTNFVGVDNYREALKDPLVRKGLLRALGFTAIFVPGMIMFPMILAVMIDRITNNRVATFYRLILLIPAMIPGPLIFVLWRLMYSLYIGPINYFLVDVTHQYTVANQPQWLGSPHLVFFSLAIMEWWWGLGYHTMFFLAGLATIPRDLPEAARLDGANEWKLFWNITVPRLFPIILVLVVLRFGTAMAIIDEYLIMGGFDRTRPTYTWTMRMFELAFVAGDWRQGYASAIGWIGAIAMLIVVAGMFYVFRSRD
ncbi:MAG: carbohydrate ABC transporter permease [Thermomicrobiales bacterium]